MREPAFRLFVIFAAAFLAQLLLLKHVPAFARTCDLVLLVVAALALSRSTSLALGFALACGMMLDSLSFSYPLFHTAFYSSVVLLLSWRRPYTYLSHSSLFVLTVAALLVGKVVAAYVWTLLFVQAVSPLMLFHVSLAGALCLLVVAHLTARRLLLALKEPEVLDFDVEH